MSTIRLGTFPSLNNKGLQDDIAKAVLTWFIHRFPVGFFNHIYLDTQTTAASSYQMNNATGELQKIESGGKILQPCLRMNVKQGMNNHNDVFGSLWNVNQQPGAFNIDTDLTGSRPFLYDPYGIILATNEYTIRNQFEIIVDLQTKADQLAFFNICDNNLKNLYVQTIESDVGIILPSLLMEYIRNSVFKSELDLLNKMVADSTEKTEYRQKIVDNFNKYLYEFSGKSIKPFREFENETGVNNYIYKLFRKQLITMKFERPDGDEGTKKGAAYTNFQVTISGWIEYANPISFMSCVPAIVRGAKTDHFIRTSSKTTSDSKYHIMEFKEVFRDDRHLLDIDGSKWAHFYLEKELLMAANTEHFNILDDVIDENDTPSHYYITKALLHEIKSKGEFDALFKVIIYKNNEPLDKYYYDIDKDFNFTIRECDLSVPYYIDIFINKAFYSMKLDIITDKLKSIGIIIDENEVNSHLRENNISPWWDEQDDRVYNADYHTDNMKHRAYWYNTDEYVGVTSENNTKIFIPIKPQDFEIADDKYDYYIKMPNDSYLPVKNEVVEKRLDLDYYVEDNSGEMIKIDRKNIMIPDPNYKYFIFDRSDNMYKQLKKINKFNITKQYYILKDEHKITKINIE